MSVDDGSFPSQHSKDITLWTHRRATSAADAVGNVDMRVLRARSVGIKLAFFRGGLGARFAFSKSLHVIPKKERGNQSGNEDGYEGVHGYLEESHRKYKSHVKQSKKREGVAEWLVHHVPEMKNLLRSRKKQDSFRKRGFFLRKCDGLFQVAMTCCQ